MTIEPRYYFETKKPTGSDLFHRAIVAAGFKSRSLNWRIANGEIEPRRAKPNMPNYLPTRDEIAAACRKVQAEWSEDEEQSRRAGGYRRVMVRIGE